MPEIKGSMLLCPFVNKRSQKPKGRSFVSNQHGLWKVETAEKWGIAKVLSDQKKACSPHVCVRSTATLLLSNSPHCLQGLKSANLNNVVVDASHSNQKVNLSLWYVVTVQALQLCNLHLRCVLHIASVKEKLLHVFFIVIKSLASLHQIQLKCIQNRCSVTYFLWQ